MTAAPKKRQPFAFEKDFAEIIKEERKAQQNRPTQAHVEKARAQGKEEGLVEGYQKARNELQEATRIHFESLIARLGDIKAEKERYEAITRQHAVQLLRVVITGALPALAQKEAMGIFHTALEDALQTVNSDIPLKLSMAAETQEFLKELPDLSGTLEEYHVATTAAPAMPAGEFRLEWDTGGMAHGWQKALETMQNTLAAAVGNKPLPKGAKGPEDYQSEVKSEPESEPDVESKSGEEEKDTQAPENKTERPEVPSTQPEASDQKEPEETKKAEDSEKSKENFDLPGEAKEMMEVVEEESPEGVSLQKEEESSEKVTPAE